MLDEYIITSNAGEKMELKWDGTRFVLVCTQGYGAVKIIILNPLEAERTANRILEVLTKEYHAGGGYANSPVTP